MKRLITIFFCLFVVIKHTASNGVEDWVAGHHPTVKGKTRTVDLQPILGYHPPAEASFYYRTPGKKYGITIIEKVTAKDVVETTVTIDHTMTAYIAQIAKGDTISGTIAMNMIMYLLCEFGVTEATLVDLADIKHHSDAKKEKLKFLKAYTGKGYSWYGNWGFEFVNVNNAHLLRDIKKYFGKNKEPYVEVRLAQIYLKKKKPVYYKLREEYQKKFGKKFDENWTSMTVGEFMTNVWNKATYEEYQWFGQQLLKIPEYDKIITDLFTESKMINRNPCPAIQRAMIEYHNDPPNDSEISEFVTYYDVVRNIVGVFALAIIFAFMCGLFCGCLTAKVSLIVK
eukprot:248785_1